MAYAVGGILAALFGLVCALLLLAMISVSDLALCSDPEAVRASGESDCIEGSSGERIAGLALGWAAVLAAALTVALALVWARRRERGAQLAAAAIATPLLALGALLLVPVSF
jgi:hypothetical protein